MKPLCDERRKTIAEKRTRSVVLSQPLLDGDENLAQEDGRLTK